VHRVVLWIQHVAVPVLGPGGVFLAAFLDSSFLSLPEINDLLVVTAAARAPQTAWLYVAAATLGSLVGCSVLWLLARRGGEAFLERRFGAGRVARARRAFRRYDVLALAVPAVLPPPMPFKLFVLGAGVFGISFQRFALTLVVARGLRYLAWAFVGIRFGNAAMALLRSFDLWFAGRLPWIAAFLGVATALWLLSRAQRRRGEPA
jgi:membrane protein YqaA with SNARE-associated domain